MIHSYLEPILVVEDSDLDFKTLVRSFKRANIANPLYRCEDGQEALDYLFQQGKYSKEQDAPRPGLILLDLNMPGVEGKKVLQAIKQNDTLRNIPVLIFTSSNDREDIEDCYQNGANTYIQKPVDFDSFLEAVQRLKDYWLGISVLPKEGP